MGLPGDNIQVVKSIVWLSDPLARGLRPHLPDHTVVGSAEEFLNEPRSATTISFVDAPALMELDRLSADCGTPTDKLVLPGPIIAISDDSIYTPIGWLASRPWLAHVISASMLQHPIFAEHLGNVITTLTNEKRPRLTQWLTPSVVGRRVRLAQASKRAERIERMAEYYDSRGVSARTIQLLRDAAEELLTNAFYDAPVAAGEKHIHGGIVLSPST